MPLITTQLLQAMGATSRNATLYEPLLQAAADRYEINTPLRVCHWLAQVFQESAVLVYTRELWDGKGQQAKYDTGVLAAKLGNTPEADGDGYHNRGVGLIQNTGEDNIEAALADIGLPPDSNDLLAKPEWAALSAGSFWNKKKLNAIADSTPATREGITATVARITKRVNGGHTHLLRRQMYFDRAMTYMAETLLPDQE